MTREFQKRTEREFVETAASCLGLKWEIQDGAEPPDFFICDGNSRFGLEVTQVFIGRTGKKGSTEKRSESDNQKRINIARSQYEECSGVCLNVKFLLKSGTILPDLNEVPKLLLAKKFEDREIGKCVKVIAIGGLKIFAQREFRSQWFLINDQVGWVVQDGNELVQNAIDTKIRSAKSAMSNPSVNTRLLVVADAKTNSGKLLVDASQAFSFSPFTNAYFMNYPHGQCIPLTEIQSLSG